MASALFSRVPIARLEPKFELPDDSAIHGIVTLLWPYASSTHSLSLLLVEPDFRLRRQRGQVRVHFQGSSAKAVARAGVSSGDELVLKLQGASWEKDPTVLSTPGRGIEWELTFGEFVLVEIHHPGQRPISLEIDHPAASPEPRRQASSPQSSPLYDKHVQGNIHEPFSSLSGDVGNIWSSPAFLKRAHFGATAFDPFAELEDDFPDNERWKRTKMGRRSGEWKFVEQTPSPEKEEAEAKIAELSSSINEPVQVGAENAAEQQAILNTPPQDLVVSISDDDSSPDVTEGSPARQNVNMTVETAEPLVRGIGTENRASIPSIGETSKVDQGHGTLEGELKEQNMIPGHVLEDTAGNAIQTLTGGSSPSIASSRSQSPALKSDVSEQVGKVRDSTNATISSGLASDFGQDGAAVEGPRQAEYVAPMASEIGRRWVEMHKLARNQHKAKALFNVGVIERPESPFKGTPTEAGASSQIGIEQSSSEVEDELNRRASSREQYLEFPEESRNGALGKEHNTKIAREHDPSEDDTTANDYTEVQTPASPEQSTSHGPVGVDVGTKVTEGNAENNLQQATTMSREKTLVDESKSDRGRVVTTTIQDSITATNTSMDSVPSRPQIIDLESDDESDIQSNPLLPAENEPTSHIFADMQSATAEPLAHGDELTKHDGSMLRGESLQIENFSSGLDLKELEANTDQLNKATVTLDSMEEVLPSHQEENITTIQEGPPVDISQTANHLLPLESSPDSIDYRKTDNNSPLQRLPTGVDQQELSTDAEVINHRQKLPSTIQDTFEGPFTGQIFTQPDSPGPDLEYQAFTQSTLLGHANETLPTIDSAQVPTTQIVALEPESMKPSDHQSSQSQGPKGSQMRMSSDDHNATAEKDLPRQQFPEGLAETHDERLQRPVTEEEYQQVSFSQPETNTPPSNSVSQKSPLSKGSSLIARVKEARRLSSQNSRRHLSGGPASPWFTSRRPSQTIIKAEAEDEVHTSSPERGKEIVIKSPTKSTPEKSEKRLSQSFIRSSPLQSPLSQSPVPSLPGSQYLPSSQVATGFRTNLSYFVSLASLHSHYGTEVDVLAIAISSTSITRAKSGPKDYNQSLFLSDPSSMANREALAPDSLAPLQDKKYLIPAQIFRPRKACFPIVDIGDAVLLRNFKVHTFQKAISLISTNSSAWAVFRRDADVQIRGPPIEYGPEERAFARAHWNWWASLDAQLRDRLAAAVPKAKTDRAKKGLGFELPSSQSQKSIKPAKSTDLALSIPVTKQSSLGSSNSPKSDEVKGKEDLTAANPRRVLRPRKAGAHASASPEKEDGPIVEEIHELRDGTRYVDRKGVGAKEVEAQRGVHELRDGTRYRDRAGE